ncbi:hypothetical protein RBJ15_04600 [Pantoea sp. BS_4]|nr:MULTISPECIES: hypothetical protein [Pantoea]MDF7784919.1 hypothetical protein [Pantoea stewartii]
MAEHGITGQASDVVASFSEAGKRLSGMLREHVVVRKQIVF